MHRVRMENHPPKKTYSRDRELTPTALASARSVRGVLPDAAPAGRAAPPVQASVSALMPGISLPSSSSSDAPPPVETCVTLSSVSYFLQHVAVSPPPITVITPCLVASTT